MNVRMKMVDIDGDDKGKLLVILIFLVDFKIYIIEGLFQGLTNLSIILRSP